MSEERVTEPIDSASEEVKQIILGVLNLEKERLYETSSRFITSDIRKIVEESVQ
jgi:hypothetical protein